MAAQKSESQIMNKLKMKSKGAWKRARKVEPKARGQGGFPPKLEGIVAVPKEFKLAETTKGDPFFSLTSIVVSPEEFKGRRATVSWFINDSQYATVEQNLEQMSNDLQLIYHGEMPGDESGLLTVLKEICDAGEPIVLNSGGPRKNGGNPNLYIQGLADVEAGEATAEGEAGEGDEGTEGEGETEGDEDEGGGDGTDGEEEGTEEEGGDWVPAVDDKYRYAPPKEKSLLVCIVKDVDEDAQTVKLATEKKDKKTNKIRVFNKVGWDKLVALED